MKLVCAGRAGRAELGATRRRGQPDAAKHVARSRTGSRSRPVRVRRPVPAQRRRGDRRAGHPGRALGGTTETGAMYVDAGRRRQPGAGPVSSPRPDRRSASCDTSPRTVPEMTELQRMIERVYRERADLIEGPPEGEGQLLVQPLAPRLTSSTDMERHIGLLFVMTCNVIFKQLLQHVTRGRQGAAQQHRGEPRSSSPGDPAAASSTSTS